MRAWIRSLSIYLLSITLMVPQTWSSERSTRSAPVQDLLAAYWQELVETQPLLLRSVLESSATHHGLVPTDPLVDVHPYFLADQKWTVSNTTQTQSVQGGYSFSSGASTLTLHHPSWTKALEISQSLLPILETPEYLFLTARVPTIFDEKRIAGSLDPAGEGAFFVAKADLVEASQRGEVGAPVFFLPLPGQGWKGDRLAFEWVATNQIVFYNDARDGVVVDLSAIRELERIQRVNLLLSQGLALYQQQQSGFHPKAMPLPLSRTTAGFGLIPNFSSSQFMAQGFTLDRIKPLLSVIPRADATNDVGSDKPLSGTKKASIVALLMGVPLGLTAALAGNIDYSQMITPDVIDKLQFFVKVMAVLGLASVTARYFVYSEKMNQLYPPQDGETKTQKAFRHIKSTFDVVAHTAYTYGEGTFQGAIYGTAYLMNRLAPRNRLLRRCFDATFGARMKRFENLPVDHKTLRNGLIYGTTDTALVAVQMMLVTPLILSLFTGDLNSAATPLLAAYITSELYRTASTYALNGAYIFSSEVKSTIAASVQSYVDRQLALDKKDPNDSVHKSLRQRLFDEEMERRMKISGLPGKEKFLFDPGTLLRRLVALTGLSPDRLGLTAEQIQEAGFHMERREWGSIPSIINEALKKAKLLQQENPTALADQAVRTLEWVKAHYKIIPPALKGLMQNLSPQEGRGYWQAVQEVTATATEESRAIRQGIYLMSAAQSVDSLLQYLPPQWVQAAGSEQGAQAAAELIHQSIRFHVESDPEHLYPSAINMLSHKERSQNALMGLAQKQPDFSDPFYQEVRRLSVLFRLKSESASESVKSNYRGRYSDIDFLARRQFERALINAKTESESTQVQIEGVEEFQKRVGLNLAREVGIEVVPESDFVKQVTDKALLEAKQILENEAEIAFISKLSFSVQEEYRAMVFGEAFLNAYVYHSVESDAFIQADSIHYPGIRQIQKIRQRHVGNPGFEKYVRPALRVLEATVQNGREAYAPGVLAKLRRSIPFLGDNFDNFGLTLRFLPYYATLSYLVYAYIWRADQPYALFVVSSSFLFLHLAMVTFNNRIMRNLGIQPNSDAFSKFLYSYSHSWFTFLNFPIAMSLGPPMQRVLESHIVQPLSRGLSACAQLLGLK